MPRDLTTGWDLGGAHLKAAQVEPGGRLVTALQIPCRLWLGIDEFAQALGEAGSGCSRLAATASP